jgi:hypothetical protein
LCLRGRLRRQQPTGWRDLETRFFADVTETSISDKIRVSINGNIVHYATAEANITATRPASSASIIFDPIVKGMAHGEDTYDARERARAAMIEATVGRFQTLTAR